MKEKFEGPASGKPESDSGVFKIKKPVIEPLDWGDFGDINGNKTSTNNPFAERYSDIDSTERELTPDEEEKVWRIIDWKYGKYRGARNAPVGNEPIYNTNEKLQYQKYFEREKRLFLIKNTPT